MVQATDPDELVGFTGSATAFNPIDDASDIWSWTILLRGQTTITIKTYFLIISRPCGQALPSAPFTSPLPVFQPLTLTRRTFLLPSNGNACSAGYIWVGADIKDGQQTNKTSHRIYLATESNIRHIYPNGRWKFPKTWMQVFWIQSAPPAWITTLSTWFRQSLRTILAHTHSQANLKVALFWRLRANIVGWTCEGVVKSLFFPIWLWRSTKK